MNAIANFILATLFCLIIYVLYTESKKLSSKDENIEEKE